MKPRSGLCRIVILGEIGSPAGEPPPALRPLDAEARLGPDPRLLALAWRLHVWRNDD